MWRRDRIPSCLLVQGSPLITGPRRVPVAVFSVGVSASMRGSRKPLGFAKAFPGGRFGPRRAFASPRPAGRVLMRSWAADASLAVVGVRDASFEPWIGWFAGGACPRICADGRSTAACVVDECASCEASLQSIILSSCEQALRNLPWLWSEFDGVRAPALRVITRRV